MLLFPIREDTKVRGSKNGVKINNLQYDFFSLLILNVITKIIKVMIIFWIAMVGKIKYIESENRNVGS